jgi:hypothetical protein
MANANNHIPNSGKKHVGYFCHLKIGEKHMGAVLVTNQIGVPVEFKYTEPVTATRLHRILYGSVLERYLHETVIRDRLAHEVRAAPDFFLAPYEEKEFLGTLGGKEMMAIQRFQPPQGESPGPFSRLRDREAIAELDDGLVLRLAFSTTNEPLQRTMVAWLQEIGRSMDVLEPIERVFTALKSICGDEKRGSLPG